LQPLHPSSTSYFITIFHIHQFFTLAFHILSFSSAFSCTRAQFEHKRLSPSYCTFATTLLSTAEHAARLISPHLLRKHHSDYG
jgi:hypothetical protein